MRNVIEVPQLSSTFSSPASRDGPSPFSTSATQTPSAPLIENHMCSPSGKGFVPAGTSKGTDKLNSVSMY